MRLSRSKSCILKGNTKKIQSSPIQPSLNRKFSLSEIKNRKNDNQQKQRTSMKLFKQKILDYIKNRSDVQIIIFYNEYKQEFYRKSVNLQNLFYQKPQIRYKYLSQENTHFFKGFQQTLLNLFRKNVIIPGQYKNLKPQCVQQIQKWVFSWIQRQLLCEKLKEQQQLQRKQTANLLDEIQNWKVKTQLQQKLF